MSTREIDEGALGSAFIDSAVERQLLDAAPDALVVVDETSTIVLVNAQVTRMFGYERRELIGQKLELLVPAKVRRGHAAHVTRYFSAPAPRPMGSGLQLSGRRKDGSELPVEVSLSPVQTAHGRLVCAAVRDVSARRRIEAQAKLSADRLASAVESIEDALALYDAETRLVLCNSAYRVLVASTLAGTVIGALFEDIMNAWLATLELPAGVDRAELLAQLRSELADARGALDVRDQRGRSLRVMQRRTSEGGIVQTVWDLTADAERQREVHEARATAEAASSAKTAFLSSMSHELRTPLNSVLGFAQLLRRDKKEPLSPRHLERVEHILKSGEHLLRLIDEVLDLSRVESGNVPISLEPVAVADLLDDVQSALAPMAERSGIQIVLEPLPDALPDVIADRTRLQQVLLNFGSNAIKYGRRAGHVVLRVTLENDAVRLLVADDGAGIALERQERLFQPFYRAGQETGAIEGTGIGLAISKRLVELMHGTIGFRSTVSVGSEFWIELPRKRDSERPAPELALGVSAASAQLNSFARKCLIVYIEDNPSNIAFMQDLLADFARVDLVTAPTAEIGIEIVRARKPDAVIMDVNLPGMSGLEATRKLRDWPETRAIPVIGLSAAATERDFARAREIGFHHYLTKPVQVDKLSEILERLIAAGES